MKINAISNNTYAFCAQQRENHKENDNPISVAGEKAMLAKTTFLAGAVLGGSFLFELAEDGFVLDKLDNASKKITSKQKNLTKNQRTIKEVGVLTGLTLLFIGAFATLYTAFKAPEINYKGNVNAFKNKKDMDVYIKSNNAERELYTQMNKKAKNADENEKQKLREQYMQMQVAKNKVPTLSHSA